MRGGITTRLRRALAVLCIVGLAVPLVGADLANPGEAEATPPPAGVANFGTTGTDSNGRVTSLTYPGFPVGADSRPIGPDGRPAWAAGALAFAGAHATGVWGAPTHPGNIRGTCYCVEEIVPGSSPNPTLQPDPSNWTARDMANAAALMQSMGEDNVIAYASGAANSYIASIGEWNDARLQNGLGDNRRRYQAAHFGIRHFLGDTSAAGGPGGFFNNARIYPGAVVGGTSIFRPALEASLDVSHDMAAWAEGASVVGVPTIRVMSWRSSAGAFISQPTTPGTYRVELEVSDSTGKPVVNVPVMQWRNGNQPGFNERRSTNAVARIAVPTTTPAFLNGRAADWPMFRNQSVRLGNDSRFMMPTESRAAGTTRIDGRIFFDVTITNANYELAFHTITPGGDVQLWRGSGSQGNVVAARAQGADDIQITNSAPVYQLFFQKTSADPTISVAGGQFAMVDGNGNTFNAFTTTASGSRTLTANAAVNPPPYSIRELVAPPGLAPITTDVAFPFPYSTNPASPTTLTLSNSPVQEFARIRKLIDRADFGLSNLSGFCFDVDRDADGTSFGNHCTNALGVTPTFFVTAGTFTATETAVPLWATPLEDGGAITFTVAPGTVGTATVSYTNNVPTLDIATSASDQSDDDQFVSPEGGTVIDAVRSPSCLLIPGTEYRFDAELMNLTDPVAGTVAPTGYTGSVTRTVTDPCEVIEVPITVPAGSVFASGGTGVVYHSITHVASGTVEATHNDPFSIPQTIWFATFQSQLSDDADGDQNLIRGQANVVTEDFAFGPVQTGAEYTATTTVMELADDGSVTATPITGSTTFTAATANGNVDVSVTIPATATFDRFVLYTVLTATATGTVVGEHTDPTAVGQQGFFPTLDSQFRVVGETGTRALIAQVGDLVTDTVPWTYLAPGNYRTDLTVMIRDDLGVCAASSIVGSQAFSVADGEFSGSVDVGPVSLDTLAGEWTVAYQQIVQLNADGSETNVIAHQDCDDLDQSLPVNVIDTFAVDNGDADKNLNPFVANVARDTATYGPVLTGIEYTATAEILEVDDAGTATATGIVGSTNFTPTTRTGTVDVTIDIPAGSITTNRAVIRQTITETATGVVVGVHDDPTDLDQMLYFAQLGSEFTIDGQTGDRAHYVQPGDIATDVAPWTGLAPGDYRAEVVVQSRNAGACTPTTLTASSTFSVVDGERSGSSIVGGFDTDAFPAQAVAYHRIYSIGAGGDETLAAAHEVCDDLNQTVFRVDVDSAVADATDGDNVIDPTLGGTLIDTVPFGPVIPGVELTATAHVVVFERDGTLRVTDLSGSATVTPTTRTGTVDVSIEIPENVDFERAFIRQTITVTATGEQIGEHNDPTALSQQFFLSRLTTLFQVTDHVGESAHWGDAGDEGVDTVPFAGLDPNLEHEARLVVHERDADGACLPSEITASTRFTPDASGAGDVQVGPVQLDPATAVAFQRIYRLNADGTETLMAGHEDCDSLEQTIRVLEIDSDAVRFEMDGEGTNADMFHLAGISNLPENTVAMLEGNVHQWDYQTPIDGRDCHDGNIFHRLEPIEIPSSGTYRSEDVQLPNLDGDYGFNAWVTVTFDDGTTWDSSEHGCRVESESFRVNQIVPEVEPPEVVPPSANPPQPDIPNTGSDATRIILVLALFFVALGGAVLTVPSIGRKPTRRGA